MHDSKDLKAKQGQFQIGEHIKMYSAYWYYGFQKQNQFTSNRSKCNRYCYKPEVPVFTGVYMVFYFRFHQIDAEWQQQTCNTLGLEYHRSNRFASASPNTTLTLPNL